MTRHAHLRCHFNLSSTFWGGLENNRYTVKTHNRLFDLNVDYILLNLSFFLVDVKLKTTEKRSEGIERPQRTRKNEIGTRQRDLKVVHRGRSRDVTFDGGWNDRIEGQRGKSTRFWRLKNDNNSNNKLNYSLWCFVFWDHKNMKVGEPIEEKEFRKYPCPGGHQRKPHRPDRKTSRISQTGTPPDTFPSSKTKYSYTGPYLEGTLWVERMTVLVDLPLLTTVFIPLVRWRTEN